MPIESGKEPSIITHLRNKSSMGARMTKWVNLPPNSWSDTEFIDNPLVPNKMVIDHILISGTSLIMHGPAGINQLKLAILHQFLYFFLFIVSLQIPPHSEELHFDLREFAVGVFFECIHNRSEFHIDIGVLDILATSIKILVKVFQPANIVMRVRHNVNSGGPTGYLIIFHIWVMLVVTVSLSEIHSGMMMLGLDESRLEEIVRCR